MYVMVIWHKYEIITLHYGSLDTDPKSNNLLLIYSVVILKWNQSRNLFIYNLILKNIGPKDNQ